MNECTKSGCRNIKMVCEDCGRVTNRVKIQDHRSTIDRLKGVLAECKYNISKWAMYWKECGYDENDPVEHLDPEFVIYGEAVKLNNKLGKLLKELE